MLVFILLVIIIVAFLVLKSNKKVWMHHGHHTRNQTILINDHTYYIEEVVFKSYQSALTNYYKIVSDVAEYGEILESDYDLYDWTYNYIRFEDTTICIKHYRSYNTIQLSKSQYPISIEQMKLDNPKLGLKEDYLNS
ncbi:hypothetical protein UJ101_00244 [Flavobacteriaceae bacterium UJ101]|nr:hypothetical protein UJ101_00244 [Flavobacteriaceae bacterium UJ101]